MLCLPGKCSLCTGKSAWCVKWFVYPSPSLQGCVLNDFDSFLYLLQSVRWGRECICLCGSVAQNSILFVNALALNDESGCSDTLCYSAVCVSWVNPNVELWSVGCNIIVVKRRVKVSGNESVGRPCPCPLPFHPLFRSFDLHIYQWG